MWFPSFLLLLAFTTVIADIEEDIEKCKNGIQELESLVSVNAAEDLKAACSIVLDAFDCLEDVLKENTGMNLKELALLTEGTEIGKGVEVGLNIKGIVKDLCEEGSSLNEAYLADADCLETIDMQEIEKHVGICKTKVREGFEASEDFAENAIEEAGGDEFSPDADCVEAAYVTACVATLVHDTCGRHAFDTINTVVKRSGIFRNMICSADDLKHLKTTFVDKLDEDNERKDLFRLALDLKKRRK